MVPDGPLHPDDAVLALVTGLVVAAVGRRRAGAWVALLFGGVAMVMILRQGAALIDGFVARPAPLAPALVVCGVALIGVVAGPSGPGSLIAGTVAACGVVWALVPDTEMALIAGGVLAGASVRPPRVASRAVGLLPVLSLAAAVVGTAGRPDRLVPAALSAVFAASAVVAVVRVACQRAGAPTTVAPAATSSVTTAPAPTTAP